MRTWMLAAATASVAMAGLANAAEPRTQPPLRGSPLVRNNALTAAQIRLAAWRQEPAAPTPPPVTPMPAVAAHSGIGIGGGVDHGAVISQSAWNNEHVYTGYVYGPGSCDHTPPCVDHLWDGYCQRPHRCGHHHFGQRLFHHHGGCGHASGCATCGGNYASCDTGCGGRLGCHGIRLHGSRHSCGCETSCTTCADSCASACGCGHSLFGGRHLMGKCGGWFNKLCNACDGGISCSCSTPVGGSLEGIPLPPADAPAPTATPDDGKSARKSLFNRYVLPVSFQ